MGQIQFWQPKEGYMLHNRINDTWSDMVLLGTMDKATDWWEEPMEAYEAWLAEQEAQRQPEQPTNPDQPSQDEQDPAQAKNAKLSAIDKHAATLKHFTLNAKDVWLTRAERAELDFSAKVWQAKRGTTPYNLLLGDTQMVLSTTMLTSILQAVEVYEIDCTEQTEAHKAAVNALTTVADIKAYNHTSGYPAKPTFITGT